MKKITKQSFLVRYALNFIVLHIVLYFMSLLFLGILEGLQISSVFQMMIVVICEIAFPILATQFSFLLSSKNKDIVDDEKDVESQFLVTQIIAIVVTFLLIYTPSIMAIALNIIGFLISYNMIIKKVENLFRSSSTNITQNQKINENENMQNEEFSKNENSISHSGIIKQYHFEKVNDENIIKFLKMNQLNTENYFLVLQMPGLSDYALYGNLSMAQSCYYLVNFDENNLYLFQFSVTNGKKIENCLTFKMNEIEKIKSVNVGVAKQIHIIFKNQQKLVLQATKIVRGIKNQGVARERFISEMSNKF